GGWSDPKPATPEVQRITNKLQFEVRANMQPYLFKAVKYRSQVVAGINYLIKVQVAATEYVHLKVLQGLCPEDECPALVSFETGKTRDDPL
ncbi:CYTA protein, partial [Campylorhamphus procurvoides]|nr:CYTA protein [Campylorhamphus procurvoides]